MQNRNSNVELLRILAMIMIIGHHYVLYGVMQSYDNSISGTIYSQGNIFNRFVSQFLFPGGVVGVGVFFIIMGYFGVSTEHIKIASIIKDTVFYSILGILIYLILGFTNIEPVDIKMDYMLKGITPICGSQYWFISVYIIVGLMKPIVNNYIRKRNNKLILVFILYYSVARLYGAYYLGLLQGLLFYIIGAMIKLNESELFKKKSFVYLLIGLCGWLMYIFFNNYSGFEYLSRLISVFGISIAGLISSVGISLFFIERSYYCNSIVNNIASSVLSVYLIHEHPLLRKVLWSDVLRVESVQWESKFFLVYALLSIVLIFGASVLFDVIRKKITGKLFKELYKSNELKQLLKEKE